MANTRSTLARLDNNLLESMGQRAVENRTHLGPAPRPKDIGRRPLSGFGKLDVIQVVADPDQPRLEFSEDEIEQLAQSLRDKGQLAPIRVRWSDQLNKWIIIAGERRWRAAKHANLPTIECIFHEDELTRSEILELQLIENLLRADLKPVEQAKAFQSLMQLNGWNGKQLAEILKIPRSSISRALALLNLPDEIQRDVDEGRVPARSAYEISKLADRDQQIELANRAAQGDLTHQDAAGKARASSNRRGKQRKNRVTRLTFFVEPDLKVFVSTDRRVNYHEIEQGLLQALDEVRLRIDNNVQIF